MKLDAIIEATSHHLFGIAEFLEKQLNALPNDDQIAFREFVKWMGKQKIKYDWSPGKLEDLFASR